MHTFTSVVDTKLTLSDPSHSLADSSSSGESVRLPLGWICFVYFLFSFVVYVICLFQVLMPACLSLLSIVWNKCARHAGSGQCFRPALFWRHHTRLGVQYFWVVTACGRSYLYWFVSATFGAQWGTRSRPFVRVVVTPVDACWCHFWPFSWHLWLCQQERGRGPRRPSPRGSDSPATWQRMLRLKLVVFLQQRWVVKGALQPRVGWPVHPQS